MMRRAVVHEAVVHGARAGLRVDPVVRAVLRRKREMEMTRVRLDVHIPARGAKVEARAGLEAAVGRNQSLQDQARVVETMTPIPIHPDSN